MGKKNQKDRTTDEIIHEEIMKEGSRLEKELGPVTFRESPDFDVEENFRQMMEARKALETVPEGEKPADGKKISGKKRPVFTAGKVAVACLVCVLCLFAFSMTSEATRMWWMKSVERVIGNESGKVVNSDENRVKTELTEKEAAAEIKKETGIPVPEFVYKPDDMVLDSYEYNAVGEIAFLYYQFEGYTVTLEINGATADATFDLNYEWKGIQKKQVPTSYAEVTLVEGTAKGDLKSTALAHWDYKNFDYSMVGKVSVDEMEKMVKSILY